MSQGVRLTLIQQTRLVVAVVATALLLYTSLSCVPLVGAFSVTPTKTSSCRLHQNHHNNNKQLYLSKIIDAEVIPDDEPTSSSITQEEDASLNLIEYSQNQDVDWKTMPIAFCDTLSNTYIDCNLAFYVKDRSGGVGSDDVSEYALGVPTEIPIVVALELDEDNDSSSDGGGPRSSSATGGGGVVNLSKVIPINPDDESSNYHDDNYNNNNILKEEEKEEIFQLAARAIMNEYGKSIRMKKTPRVLTLEGNLDDLIGDWKDVLLGSNGGSGKKTKDNDNNNMSIDDALNIFDDEDDDEEDFFDKIMKRDLGENYMSLLDDDEDDNAGISDEELLKLFDNSVGEDGDDDLNALLDDIETNESKFKDTTYDQLVQQLQPSAALKLINFVGPDDTEYTILRPLRPILLIGREDPDDYTRRILLTEEERNAILPRLERSCREGLEEAGFFLSGTSD